MLTRIFQEAKLSDMTRVSYCLRSYTHLPEYTTGGCYFLKTHSLRKRGQFNKTCIIGSKLPALYISHLPNFNPFCQQVFHLKYNSKVGQFYQIDYGFLPIKQKPKKQTKTVTKGAGYVLARH
jgi:hypothetical protein